MFGRTEPILAFVGPFGIRVDIEASLIFLILIVLGIGGAEHLAASAVFAAMLVGSIFLHELGHAWAAMIQGIPVTRIVLHGGGGLCEQRQTATPHQEELIVAMGPMVNLGLWAVSGLLVSVAANPLAVELLAAFATINLFLAIFNLMPVFPLDGGRLIHLVFLRIMAPETAAQAAGAVGLVVAVLWLPAMALTWVLCGFVMLFIPSIVMHWRLMRGVYN